ncbi:MAG: L,D-transpeptidase family protein [Synergistes sp.]|nr:L,D-transpeptidase family protein [Synergistes sp.]
MKTKTILCASLIFILFCAANCQAAESAAASKDLTVEAASSDVSADKELAAEAESDKNSKTGLWYPPDHQVSMADTKVWPKLLAVKSDDVYEKDLQELPERCIPEEKENYPFDRRDALEETGIWREQLAKYAEDENVNQILFVKNHDKTDADVVLYEKNGLFWEKTMSVPGHVGENGIGKVSGDDNKTPIGTFSVTGAFGKKPDPGAKAPYRLIDENLYFCKDKVFYNELIDIREKPYHKCTGVHMADYDPEYNYGLFTDYNPKNKYGLGAGIFIRCFGKKPYTFGCISVSEKDMIELVKRLEPGAKVAIYDISQKGTDEEPEKTAAAEAK